MTTDRQITYEEWEAEGIARFGEDHATWSFVCPSCGHVAMAGDYWAAGAPSGAIGFSCIGRWANGNDAATFKRNGGPCTYAGGGLFCISPVTVIFPDGKKLHVFDWAELPVNSSASQAAGGAA